MSENTASIIIDGSSYTFNSTGTEKEKRKLLQFALDSGVEIPYFCYHEGMSIPTNCRMCLIEMGMPMVDRATGQPVLDEAGEPKINWSHKPLTSCNLDLAPGMIVKTAKTSPKIKKAQEGVLEFMLINHPLDCPICDQAGECPLQINTYKFGPEGSRYELSKVHKPKRIELGQNVTLDAERCINCTRCTRFTEEISKTDQLTIVSRGDKNHPSVAPGKTFDDAYSMNVIDLCPVGALTSTDFRFKARVWEMSYTPSLCTGCAKGCSVDVWVKDNQVLRQTPRENRQINDWWMCDEGRLDFDKLNTTRVSGIKAKGDLPLTFDDGIHKAAEMLKSAQDRNRVLFVASPYASLESNIALSNLAKAYNNSQVVFVENTQAGWGDNFLRRDDRTPNRAACIMLGFTPISVEELNSRISVAELSYMLENDALMSHLAETLKAGAKVIVHASNHSAALESAAIVLPAATHIESPGIYLNENSVAQLSRQAKEIRQMSPEMWMSMSKSRNDKGAVFKDNWKNIENIVDCLPSYAIISRIAKKAGIAQIAESHKEAFAEAKHTFPEALKDLKLSRFVPKESFKMHQFEFAIN